MVETSMIDLFKHNISSKKHQQLSRAASSLFQEFFYETCPDESKHSAGGEEPPFKEQSKLMGMKHLIS